MANLKTSDEADGSPPQGTDEIRIARAGSNRKLSLTNLFSRPLALGANAPSTGEFTDVTLQNANAVKWKDTAATVISALKLDASNIFNVGLQGAAASAGHLALWANGVEKARLIAAGALLIGATAAAGSEKLRVEGSSYLNGYVGIATAPETTAIVKVTTTHTSVGITGYVFNSDVTAPSTMTGTIYGYYSILRTAASAFTCGNLQHFTADQTGRGAGSSITNVMGFAASNNAFTSGSTNNYGFWSNIASAATTWQLYMGGTAQSYFGGPVGVLDSTPLANGALCSLGNGVSHPATVTNAFGVDVRTVAPSTMTAGLFGYRATLSTAAAAFTITNVIGFGTVGFAKGGGSTITNVKGFSAINAIAVGTNNYGFFSDINAATTTYQLYMGGTAQSLFNGPIGIIQPDPLSNNAYLAVGSGAVNHFSSGVRGDGVLIRYVAPSTMTSTQVGVSSALTTANVSFTLTQQIHFFAEQSIKGAANTLTNVRGFYASNNIAVGTSNYGFYSDIASAANTFQLNMAGTALSQFTGGVILNTTAAPTVGANQVGLGATVAATASAGSGAAAPATVEGYLIVNIAGTARKIPYYAT